MRNKDILTISLVIFWLIFILILPIKYGLKDLLIIIMFIISLLTTVFLIPQIIVYWYDKYEKNRWLDEKVINKIKFKKYFY